MSTNLPLALLSEMAIFVKVVEASSFSVVARQLGVSPSAISRSVSRLRKHSQPAYCSVQPVNCV